MPGMRMIADARPLQPEFVPGDVRHRDGEINALTSTLKPITRGQHADPAFLHGPSGTGKTCVARYAVERLRERVIDLTTQYVNCWENYTRFKTLYRVLEGLNGALDVHRQSTPRDELLDRLRDALENPCVVVLDEVDQLEEKEVLYDLNRTSNLSLVLIANNDTEVFAQVDDRVASRLQSSMRIHFDHYSMDELVAILRDRVRWGLHEDAVSGDHLRWIADTAAGDARVAIGTLRAAAQLADEQGLAHLTDEVLREAAPEAKAEITRQSLEKLTDDQRVLYDIICDGDGVQPDALYDAYCKQVADPRTQRTVRNYLQKMRRYNIVETEGRGKARTYRPVE